MKKLIALLLIAVLALSAAACSSQPADTQAPAEGTEAAAPADGAKVVKIGVFEPASGDNGAGGKQETLGVQYANKVQPTVEIGGETYNVELVIVQELEKQREEGILPLQAGRRLLRRPVPLLRRGLQGSRRRSS